MDIMQLATASTLVLTPNQRLAHYLSQRYPHMHSTALRQWLQECWSKLEQNVTLLSDVQERQIWRDIITRSIGKLVTISTLATLAQQAWHLYHKWELPALTTNQHLSEEVAQFSQWAVSFRAYCESKQLLSSSEMIPCLSAAYRQLIWPETIVLVNFTSMNTQLNQFLQQLPSQITSIDLEESATVNCLAFADVHTEFTAMAEWAKQQNQRHPTQTIQCVVPNLAAKRSQVQHALTTADVTNFTLHNTEPLLQLAIVKAAFILLSLNSVHLVIDQLTELLLSRFIQGADAALYSRARLDVQIRNLGLPQVSWPTLFTTAQATNPDLVTHLKNYLELRQHYADQTADLSVWRDRFNQLLASLGWPGDFPYPAFQLNSWQQLLDQFVTLPLMEATVSYPKALALLEQLARETEAEITGIHEPIEVIDVRTAAILPCDVRWVAGMHARAWPNPIQLNPLLPFSWQTQYRLPHSNATHELAFAKQLTKRLSSSAKQVIFSYPLQENDEAVSISPLLKNFPQEIITSAPIASRAAVMFASRKLSLVLDQTPALTDEEKRGLRGGSGLLRAQAACPFQAFARYRLAAKPLLEPDFARSPSERGRLVHRALAILWRQLHSHAELLAMQAHQLDTLIRRSVAQAMRSSPWQKLSPTWHTLEELCLIRLLSAWLEAEKKRPAFNTIAHEKSGNYRLGDLNLQLILDRIDSLADGSQVVIDYKTGAQNITLKDWSGIRPKDPQLLLYCVVNPQIRGSIIAQIRLPEPKLFGLTAQACGIAGVVDTDWQLIIDGWTTVLTRLAEQFSAGNAAVDPRDQTVCTYCDFPSLCRIHSSQEMTE